jgi:thiamine biosynthesis lipoprotein
VIGTEAAALREHQFLAMGTTASLLMAGAGVREFGEAADQVEAILRRIGARFSLENPESELSQIHLSKAPIVDVSDEMQRVLDGCRLVEAMTDGAFRPRNEAGDLDPTGFVTGWAIKRSGAALTEAGFSNWCLNVGGDILTSGLHEERPWHVAIQNPEEPTAVVAVLEISDVAVATSGHYAREIDGLAAPHIWNAEGQMDARLGSMTVVGPSVDIADALATGCWAMGNAAFEVLEKIPEYHLMKVEADAVMVSEGFPFLAIR